MLDRLVEEEYYFFLDGYSGYIFKSWFNQKTKKRPPLLSPFGLLHSKGCHLGNVMHWRPSIVVQCLYSLIWWRTLLKHSWIIFSVVWDSFDGCLSNLFEVLKRCEDCSLVLNLEIVKKRTVLGHRIFQKGIKVKWDKSGSNREASSTHQCQEFEKFRWAYLFL